MIRGNGREGGKHESRAYFCVRKASDVSGLPKDSVIMVETMLDKL